MAIKVLLVDDEKELAVNIAERLTRRGMSVETAWDGESAIQYVEQGRAVDVIVLDVLMPGINGVDALKEIKRIKPDVGVILLTGYGDIEAAREGVAAGAAAYLIKPTGIDSLAKTIQAAHSGEAEIKEQAEP
jgi:DNA-binding NtrC family response regulator